MAEYAIVYDHPDYGRLIRREADGAHFKDDDSGNRELRQYREWARLGGKATTPEPRTPPVIRDPFAELDAIKARVDAVEHTR